MNSLTGAGVRDEAPQILLFRSKGKAGTAVESVLS